MTGANGQQPQQQAPQQQPNILVIMGDDQQPQGWPGEKVTTDMPTIVNLRQDPFERTPSIRSENLNEMSGGYMNEFYAREFRRFVGVQQEVAKLAQTAIQYPPMQRRPRSTSIR